MTDAVINGARLLLDVASGIQTLGDNYYKATAEWKEFPKQVALLEQKVKFWEWQMAQYGMRSDTTLVKALDEVKTELEDEKNKLEMRQASGGKSGRWQFTAKRLTFPSQLGSSLTRAIAEVQKMMTEEDEVATGLQKRAFRRWFSLPISKDNRYVPMIRTEAAVSNALENAAGPHVVLLHGEAGRGKTSVAKNMALRYKEKNFFEDGVFLMKCGPNANILEKQKDLLEMCHPGSASPFQQAGQPSEIWIHGRLRSLLKDTRRLIILDDVFDLDLLQSIVRFCGDNVKCLVTSQRADLCRNADEKSYVSIRIEDVSGEQGRQIMASHLGFTNNEMPDHLTGYCDELVKAADFHPLAITTIANGIPKQRRDEANVWKTALRDIFRLLQSEEKVSMYGETYPRTFWIIMKSPMESLSPEARKVLLLTQAIKSPSIHEEVMNLMYQSNIFGKSNLSFSQVRSELEGKGLLRIESEFYTDMVTEISADDLTQTSHKYGIWYLHSLSKKFISKVMNVEGFFASLDVEMGGHSLLTPDYSLDGDENDIDKITMIAICAMFFEEPFAARFASKLQVSCDILEGRRQNALSLILRMLYPVNLGSDQTAKVAATKLLVQYICNGILDEKAAVTLLTPQLWTTTDVPQLFLCILFHAVRNIGKTDFYDWDLLVKNIKGVLKALGEVLPVHKYPVLLYCGFQHISNYLVKIFKGPLLILTSAWNSLERSRNSKSPC